TAGGGGLAPRPRVGGAGGVGGLPRPKPPAPGERGFFPPWADEEGGGGVPPRPPKGGCGDGRDTPPRGRRVRRPGRVGAAGAVGGDPWPNRKGRRRDGGLSRRRDPPVQATVGVGTRRAAAPGARGEPQGGARSGGPSPPQALPTDDRASEGTVPTTAQ